MTIKVRDLLLAVPVLAASWLLVLALVMRLGGPAPAALVVLPSARFWQALPTDVAVTSLNGLGVTLQGGTDLVVQLYDAGALLVLPAGLAGCLGL